MRRSNMLIVTVLAAIVLAVFLYGKNPVQAMAAPPTDLSHLKTEKAIAGPVASWVDASGAKHGLAQYRGHYVLLNLWATWCPPCVRELPALAKLQRAIPSPRLAVVTVDVEKNGAKLAAPFLKAHDAGNLPSFVDPGMALYRAVKVYGLPTTVLIDPKGREIARSVGGGKWDTPAAVAWFRTLTAAKGSKT